VEEKERNVRDRRDNQKKRPDSGENMFFKVDISRLSFGKRCYEGLKAGQGRCRREKEGDRKKVNKKTHEKE